MTENFFLDNLDLQYRLQSVDLEEAVDIFEEGYRYHVQHPGAPRNYRDAKDNYRLLLNVLGEICAEHVAPRAAEADEEGKAPAKSDWESKNIPIHPLRLANEINRFMDREGDIVVADGGDTQVWMGITRTARNSGRYLDAGLYGCLGVGIPYANAAKLRYPDQRVCLIIGDGSVGFNFMEFETALRKKLPIVMVISNDLGWGMIRHSQELRIGHAIETGTYIGKVDYHKMIEALGGKGLYVEDPADIRPALEEAFAAGIATCINVMTDPTTVSPGSVALANLGGYMAQAQ